MSKIEDIIEEIEEFIDSCKYQPLSNTKIIVNRDQFDELIADLKRNIPDEIKKYQRIIANRDAILKDAQDKSDEIVKQANEMSMKYVSEHEIMLQAYKEANKVIDDASERAEEILNNATIDANAVKEAAMQYTDDSLAKIQEILSNSIQDMTVKYDAIIRSLEANLDVTTQNRKSLHDTPSFGNDPRAAVPDNYEDYSVKQQEYVDPYYGQYTASNANELTIEDALSSGNVDVDTYNPNEQPFSPDSEVTNFSLNVNDF